MHNFYLYLSTLYTSVFDRLYVRLNNALQTIEDPRLRFATLAYTFVKTCRVLKLDPRRVIEYVDRGIEHAEKQDTSELRGTTDYIRQEYRV